MSHVVIDGYNLLAQSNYSSRDLLLKDLKIYQKNSDHQVTIFFDGTHQGTGTGDKYHEEYVEIIFSPLTVTADEMIEEYVEKNHHSGMIIVSSDKRIQKAATSKKLSFLESQEFLSRLKFSTTMMNKKTQSVPWMEGRTTEEEDYSGRSTKKRGNAHKKSKQERKKQKAFKKL